MENKKKKSRSKRLYAIASVTAVILILITLNTLNTNPEQIAVINNIKVVRVSFTSSDNSVSENPKIKVPFDLNIEKASQKSVDAGHSPWRLDPAFVAQVFVSLKISPQGIQGDYPISYESFKVVKSNKKEAIVEVRSTKTPIKKVYLKRLIKTG